MRWDEFTDEPLYRRNQLPQVNPEHLDRAGIGYERIRVPIGDLEPGQTDEDLKPRKIQKCIKNIQSGEIKPLVVDRDLRIVNGHHRYAAAQKLNMDTMQVFRAELPLEQIVKRTRDSAPIRESSPDTPQGSFTPDLVASKEWLCDELIKHLDDTNVGTVYALGSWYGNIGHFLQARGIQFDRLVLVEIDPEKLATSRELLRDLDRQGRLETRCQPAETVEFERPCIVINTSANEMSTEWLQNVPPSCLVAIQCRNGVNSDQPTPTDTLVDVDHHFPLRVTTFTGRQRLQDPTTQYTRFMKIGWA